MTERMDRSPKTRSIACGLIGVMAVLLVSGWTAARVHYAFGGNWTGLFWTGTYFHVPPDLDRGTYRVQGTGYDGQFYRYLAHDPLLTKNYARYVTPPQLRFRRLLVPVAAWLCAFGQGGWIDGAYFAVEMLFLGAGVYWCGRLFVRRGCPAQWGLLFVSAPATMASFDRMLVDGPLLALFAGFLLYSEEQRPGRVWVVAMLAALTRETGLLFGGARVAAHLLRREWRRAGWFALSAAPAAIWYAYVALRLPRDKPIWILAPPVWGLVRRLFWLRPYPDPGLRLLLHVTDVLAVLGLMASIVIAVWWLTRMPVTPVTLCVAVFTGLGLVLGAPAHMIDAFGFARPVSPLLLWVMIEAVSRRKWGALVPPLLVSLSVALVFANPAITILRGLLQLAPHPLQ